MDDRALSVLFVDTLSAKFNECIKRTRKSHDDFHGALVPTYFPAADAEQEAEDIALLLLRNLFDVFVGALENC